MFGKLLRIAILVSLSQTCSNQLSSQQKGLLFDDVSFQRNVPVQFVGPAFQEVELPTSFSLKEYCPVARDQGNIGSCVGWAVGYAAYSISDAIRRKSTSSSDTYSALYIYNHVKIADCDSGAFLDRALNFVKENGNCTFSEFNPADCWTVPRDVSLTKVKDFQALFRSDDSPDVKLYAMKQKLASNYPVIIGFETNNFFSGRYINKYDSVWRGGGARTGGHAVTVVGYDDNKQTFQILNSWGQNFGVNGFYYMKYQDFVHYTRNAAIVIFPQLVDEQRFHFKGNTLLKIFNVQRRALENVQIAKVNSHEYTTLNKTWRLGDIFQLQITSYEKGQYIYVFSLDNKRKATIHFPRRYSTESKSPTNTVNESEFFTSPKSTLVVPNTKSGMRLGSSEDVIVVLFTRTEVPNFDLIVKKVTDETSSLGNVIQALEMALRGRLILSSDVDYSLNDGTFSYQGTAEAIVPMLIRLKGN